METNTKSGSTRRQVIKGLALALGTAAGPLRAQSYPARPIRAVQGFAAGGNADTIARIVGAEMAKTLGQSVIVDAVTGAGGTLASAAVARAPADGYTLLLATGGHAVTGAMYGKLPYDPLASFRMVSTITYFPFLIVVPVNSKFQNFSDLLNAARETPGQVTYGTAGVGTTHHLAGELLSKKANIQMLHVPYRGDTASTTALIGGEVVFTIAPATAVEAFVRSGRLRALAVTGPQRWLGMAEIPTVAEQGVPDYDVRSWAGWMLPAAASQAQVTRLNEATRQALLSADVRNRLKQMGGEAQASSPAEMTTLVANELQKWSRVVADAAIPKL